MSTSRPVNTQSLVQPELFTEQMDFKEMGIGRMVLDAIETFAAAFGVVFFLQLFLRAMERSTGSIGSILQIAGCVVALYACLVLVVLRGEDWILYQKARHYKRYIHREGMVTLSQIAQRYRTEEEDMSRMLRTMLGRKILWNVVYDEESQTISYRNIPHVL